jgi:hypothetical protein
MLILNAIIRIGHVLSSGVNRLSRFLLLRLMVFNIYQRSRLYIKLGLQGDIYSKCPLASFFQFATLKNTSAFKITTMKVGVDDPVETF